MTGHSQLRSDCQPRVTSHDWIIPGFSRKRVANERAASIMTSLYLGTLVVRHPLPKLQFIMKPTSWCQVSFLASSMAEVYLSANDKRVVSPLSSYRYHTDPGKKPLRQSA